MLYCDSGPAGEYKVADAYLSVPYYSGIDKMFYYSDEYCEGYIALVDKREIEIGLERYWLLIYIGNVRLKNI